MKRTLLFISMLCMISIAVAQTTHLQFNGIPINGSYSSFTNKLKARQFKYNSDFEQTSNPAWHGTLYGHSCGLFLGRNENNTSIFNVIAVIYADSKENQKTIYNTIKRRLINDYSHADFEETKYLYYDYNPEDITKDEETVFTIKDNKNNTIGTIVLSSELDFDGTLSVFVKYTDTANDDKFNPYKDENIPKARYDISSYVPFTQNCSLTFYEYSCELQGNYNNKKFRIVANRDDYDDISLITNTGGTEEARTILFSAYVRSILSQNPPADVVNYTQNKMHRLLNAYVQEKEKQKKAAYRFTLIDILNAISPGAFSEAEKRLYIDLKTLGGRNSNRGSGSQKYYCSSCGASFSNQADLRSHENSAHDY